MRLEMLDPCQMIYCIHDLLLPQECQAYIAMGERMGFKPAPLTTARGPVLAPEVRNHTRVMFDNPAVARGLWERVRPLVPPVALAYDDEERQSSGLNERFRIFRYDVNERFAPHYDGAYCRNHDEGSLLTFLVYLNDDFEGGETRFFTDHKTLRLSLRPRAGMALVFMHSQLHEGSRVSKGRKYALRSDVMYSRPRVLVA